MKYYAYEDFRDDSRELIKQMKSFDARAIIAIARGGLTIAHCIAEGMDIREVHSLRTELYDKTQKRDCISVFNTVALSHDIQRVLVLDDISDSGDTLKAVMEDLRMKHTNIEFRSATLFYKKTSSFEPDFWVKEAKEWIEFFWEKDFKG
jgi:xanthine phosphoribosyltransferase